jgi:glycosyltransferase 2 family protein
LATKERKSFLRKIIPIIIITSTVLYLLSSKIGLEIYKAIEQFDLSVLWIACFFYIIALALAAVNWLVIINSFTEKISWKEHVRIFLLTIASRRLPGTVWYIGGRIALYKQKKISAVIISVASGVEIIVGFISGLFLGVLFIPFGINISKEISYILYLLLFFLVILINPKIIKIFLKIIKRPMENNINYIDTLKWFFINLGLKIVSGLMIGFLATGFFEIGINEFLMIIGAWALSSALGTLAIFLPSNFGITEISFTGLLTASIPFSISVSIAIMARVITTIFELFISSLVFLFFPNSSDSDCTINTE